MFGIILFTVGERKSSSKCSQEGLVGPGLTLEQCYVRLLSIYSSMLCPDCIQTSDIVQMCCGIHRCVVRYTDDCFIMEAGARMLNIKTHISLPGRRLTSSHANGSLT